MRRARGYLLLELLVAVAIFAVVAALAWGGLDAVVRTREATDAQAARLAELQRAVVGLERDLREVAARPVRGTAGQIWPAVLGGATTLELTHAAYASLSVPRSPALARSQWGIDGGRLLRRVDPVLDRPPGAPLAPVAMLADVESFTLRYLDGSGTWREEWPPRAGAETQSDVLPRAVEFRLRLSDLGEITRMVELPEGNRR
jgi:general secretion pathway protein J